jgi:hypothetical protein
MTSSKCDFPHTAIANQMCYYQRGFVQPCFVTRVKREEEEEDRREEKEGKLKKSEAILVTGRGGP